MAREPYKVDPATIFNVIARSDQPVLMIGEIADRLDVAEPTIHDHIDKTTDIPGVKSKKVGNATVYWYDRNDLDEVRDTSFEFSPQFQLELKAEKRARWLLNKQQIQHFVADGEESPELRAWAWERLDDYIGTAGLHTRVDVESWGGDGDYEINHEYAMVNPDPEDITTEEIERYLLDVHFFTSSWFGEVRGYIGLREFDMEHNHRLREVADEFEILDPDLSGFPTQELDEIHPSIPDILGAGEIYDRLVCKMLGFEW